jgi:hypothetical protein
MAAYRTWLAVGVTGIFVGFGLFFAAPGTTLSHLGLLIAVAAPVIAFYRLMKPAIGRRHCPTRPEWPQDMAGGR